MLWEEVGECSFSADEHLVIFPTLARFSKIVRTAGSKFADHVNGLFDEFEASHVAVPNAEKNVEQQKGLVSIAERSASMALNDVDCYRECVAVTSMHEADLLSGASAASSQTVKIAAELR